MSACWLYSPFLLLTIREIGIVDVDGIQEEVMSCDHHFCHIASSLRSAAQQALANGERGSSSAKAGTGHLMFEVFGHGVRLRDDILKHQPGSIHRSGYQLHLRGQAVLDSIIALSIHRAVQRWSVYSNRSIDRPPPIPSPTDEQARPEACPSPSLLLLCIETHAHCRATRPHCRSLRQQPLTRRSFASPCVHTARPLSRAVNGPDSATCRLDIPAPAR